MKTYASFFESHDTSSAVQAKRHTGVSRFTRTSGVTVHPGAMHVSQHQDLVQLRPPATALEIRDASLQFARKLSGFNVPPKANRAASDRAVGNVAAIARTRIESLVTSAGPRNRDVESAKAKALAAMRFGSASR